MAWLRVTDPRGRTRLEPLEGDRTVLGRSASCDIRVDDQDVGLRHVSVLRTERGYLVVAESDALPIWKDDEQVTNTFLEDGGDYRIGSTTIRFVDNPTEQATLGSAATMAATEQAVPPRGKTLLGPPSPDEPPSESEPTTPSEATDAPGDGSSQTQPQGSGVAAEEADSTRTVSPGPPVPSSTPTLPGRAEASSQTEVARPHPRPGTTPPWKTDAPPPRTGRTVVAHNSPAPPALQLVPHKRTLPPTPRPNPEGSTPTEPPPLHGPNPGAPMLDPASAASTAEPPDPPPDPPKDDAPTVPPGADSGAVPPVRFPPSERDGVASTKSWVWRKGGDASAKSTDSVYSLGAPKAEVHRSTESWGWTEGAERPEGRAELEPEVELPPGGPKQGHEAPARPVPPPPPPSEPVAAPPAEPPPPPPTPEPEPPPRERPRVEPVLLPARRHDEPPLPSVSKQLSSGHSWMWALPQSLRDGPDASRRLRGSNPLVVAGVVLVLIGAGLIGIAFLFGLTTDAIARAVGGGA